MDKNIKLGLDIEKLNRIISRKMDARIMAAVGDKITVSQAYVIDFISMNEDRDIFQKDIEKQLSLKRASVSLMLNNMEKNQLIKRVSVESDARLKKIVLTEKAKEINKKISESIGYVEDKLTEGLTEEEIRVFQNIMKKIEKNLE